MKSVRFCCARTLIRLVGVRRTNSELNRPVVHVVVQSFTQSLVRARSPVFRGLRVASQIIDKSFLAVSLAIIFNIPLGALGSPLLLLPLAQAAQLVCWQFSFGAKSRPVSSLHLRERERVLVSNSLPKQNDDWDDD